MPRDRVRVTHEAGGEQITKQSDALETDINQIVNRWVMTGIPPENRLQPTYGDFSTFNSYHDALNRVAAAQEEFLALPSAIRQYVENDPGKFLDLVFDPSRRSELEDLGLVDAQVPPDAKPDPTPPGSGEPPAGNPGGDSAAG